MASMSSFISNPAEYLAGRLIYKHFGYRRSPSVDMRKAPKHEWREKEGWRLKEQQEKDTVRKGLLLQVPLHYRIPDRRRSCPAMILYFSHRPRTSETLI